MCVCVCVCKKGLVCALRCEGSLETEHGVSEGLERHGEALLADERERVYGRVGDVGGPAGVEVEDALVAERDLGLGLSLATLFHLAELTADFGRDEIDRGVHVARPLLGAYTLERFFFVALKNPSFPAPRSFFDMYTRRARPFRSCSFYAAARGRRPRAARKPRPQPSARSRRSGCACRVFFSRARVFLFFRDRPGARSIFYERERERGTGGTCRVAAPVLSCELPNWGAIARRPFLFLTRLKKFRPHRVCAQQGKMRVASSDDATVARDGVLDLLVDIGLQRLGNLDVVPRRPARVGISFFRAPPKKRMQRRALRGTHTRARRVL